MSFLYYFPTNKTNYRKNNIKTRKEKDSFLAHHFSYIAHFLVERASAFASKGSITLEAALVIPIFFFGILCLVFLLEIMSIQLTVRSALYSVGKEIAQEAYVSPIISTSSIEQHLIKNIGKERLENSIVVGGAQGLNCNASKSNWNTAVIDLSVRYQLEIPVLMFRIPVLMQEETLRVKGWNGYAGGWESSREEMVYVTDYGIVYHKDMYCTYLELSIRAALPEQIENLRNQSGEKYSACKSCGVSLGKVQRVFVTDYGNRYHTSLECSGIKRNIYAIPIGDAYGLGGCPKCGE